MKKAMRTRISRRVLLGVSGGLVPIFLLGFLLLGCGSPISDTVPDTASDSQATDTTDDITEIADESSEPIKTVELPESVIRAAIKEAKDKTTWGISLPKVRTNYVVGVEVVAATVLHNGSDADRRVSLSYITPNEATLDADTGLWFGPPPRDGVQWVSIEETELRLVPMETKVVTVRLFVPQDYTDLPDRWEFGIRAVGAKVLTQERKIVVTTVENDTVLQLHLSYPLLDNQLSSILDITSDLDGEEPRATSYNPVTGMLTIADLEESAVREMVIRYEYNDLVAIGYVQRWLITMVR